MPLRDQDHGVRLTPPLGFGEADRFIAAGEDGVDAAVVLVDLPLAAIVLADEKHGWIAAEAWGRVELDHQNKLRRACAQDGRTTHSIAMGLNTSGVMRA